MKTKSLIDDLSKNLAPSKAIPKTVVRTFQILAVALLGVGSIFILFSVRNDLHSIVDSPIFIFSGLVLVLAWTLASYSLSILQIPTIEDKKYLILALLAVCTLVFVYLVRGVFWGSAPIQEGLAPSGVKCSLDILFLSTLPGVLLFFLLRKGAPVQISLVGANTGLCCAMLGAFALQFSCPSNLDIHLLVWHLLIPFAVLFSFGAWLAQKFLKW